MKTAVDGIGQHRERRVNARFHAMTSHYLFAAEFCNRAAGWGEGAGREERAGPAPTDLDRGRGPPLARSDTLNAWLASECRAAWPMQAHPDASDITVAEALEDEQPHLMPMPAPFDGYIERPVRVSSTALVSFQRNRYSVPCEHAHAVASLRVYPFELAVVVGEAEVARHRRSFERDRVHYDWQHYIALVQRKPGHCVTARRSCPCPTAAQAAAGVAAPASRRPRHGPGAGRRTRARARSGTGGGGTGTRVRPGARRPRAQRAGAIAASDRTIETVASRVTLRHPPVSDPACYDALREADHVDA